MDLRHEVPRWDAYTGAGWDEAMRTTRNLVLHMSRERCPSNIHMERSRKQSEKQEKRSGLKVSVWSHHWLNYIVRTETQMWDIKEKEGQPRWTVNHKAANFSLNRNFFKPLHDQKLCAWHTLALSGWCWICLENSHTFKATGHSKKKKKNHNSKKCLSGNVFVLKYSKCIRVRTQEVADTQAKGFSHQLSTVNSRITNHGLVARFKHQNNSPQFKWAVGCRP